MHHKRSRRPLDWSCQHPWCSKTNIVRVAKSNSETTGQKSSLFRFLWIKKRKCVRLIAFWQCFSGNDFKTGIMCWGKKKKDQKTVTCQNMKFFASTGYTESVIWLWPAQHRCNILCEMRENNSIFYKVENGEIIKITYIF